MSKLFSDDIQNRFLNVKETIFSALHTGQLCIQHPQLLHFQYFIVTSSIIEWVGSLSEVVHHIGLVEDRYPGGVTPGHVQWVF